MPKGRGRSGFPFKTLLVGVVLSVAIPYAVVHLEMVVGWQVAILQFPPIAVGVLFLLVLLNRGVKAILGRAPLKASDIVIIYTMVCITALISNRNQTGIFTICLPSLNYFASATNSWQEKLFPLVKPWLVPFDPMRNGEPGPIRQLVVRRYFEGLRDGEVVPWADWTIPLLCWSALFLSILFAFLFLAALLRKPWVEHEKLVFPFTLVPLELAQEKSFRSFFRSKLTWVGMGIPVFIYTVNLLHANFPAMPELNLDWGSIQPMLTSWPWVLLNAPPFWLSLGAIGIAYFLPGDFVFSFWFFCWFYRFQWVAVNAFGVTPPDHSHYRFGIEGGAYCALALLLLRSLLRQWRQILRSPQGDELVPPKLAFLGLGFCILTASIFVWAMGVTWWMALLAVTFYLFVEALVRARSVHEGGALMTENGFRADMLLRVFPGKDGLTAFSMLPPQSILSFAFLAGSLIRDLRGISLTAMLDGLKMTDAVNLKRRSLLLPILLSILIGYACGVLFHVKTHYEHGVLNLAFHGRAYPVSFNQGIFNYATCIIDGLDQWSPYFLGFFIYSALLTAFVALMRAFFSWWPLHPLAISLCTGWAVIVLWFPFFVGWVLKVTILRYGGSRLFSRLKPFFLGLILGEFTMAVIIGVICAIDPNIRPPWLPIL